VSPYAQSTEIPIDRSKAEIEKVLQKHGSSGFMYMSDHNKAIIGFIFNGLQYKIGIEMPKREAFSQTPQGRARHGPAAERIYEQACRSKWRALLLVIKAKLEAVEQGISSIEREFAADLVMADGRTLYAHLSKAMELGKLPKALPGFGGTT
jgi:hypothetical protein